MVRLLLLVLGVWVGVAGMLAHRMVWYAGGVVWPWGLALALATTWLVAREASRVQRVGGAWFGLGWAGAVMIEQAIGGTSYLVTTDWIGWSLMLGGLGVIGLHVVRAPRL